MFHGPARNSCSRRSTNSNMRSRLLAVALTASALSVAAEPEVDRPTTVQVPVSPSASAQPWLGVQLSKVDPSMATQLPALPPGIGMLVNGVEKDGPGDIAKLQPFDVIWKMGDQLLINEAQLATLLRLSKPGDEVKLSVFRGGQAMEMKVKLGDLPEEKTPYPIDLAQTAILPTDTGPMRVVNLSEQTASYSSSDGKATLRREGGAYIAVIKNAKDEVIFAGDVSSKELVGNVPSGWQRRVSVLRQGLEQAIQGGMVPVRPPRPRVVPQVSPIVPPPQSAVAPQPPPLAPEASLIAK